MGQEARLTRPGGMLCSQAMILVALLAALASAPAIAAPDVVDSRRTQERAGELVQDARAPRRAPLRVSDAVWRSSRLDEEGLAALYELGIKTILNLENADERRREAEALARIEARREASGLPRRHIESLNVPMNGLRRPSFANIDDALAVLGDPAKAPVLVHCRHGEDRTGVVVAAYRAEIERRLSLDEAVAEAKSFRCCHLVLPGPGELREFLVKYRRHRDMLSSTPISPVAVRRLE